MTTIDNIGRRRTNYNMFLGDLEAKYFTTPLLPIEIGSIGQITRLAHLLQLFFSASSWSSVREFFNEVSSSLDIHCIASFWPKQSPSGMVKTSVPHTATNF